MSRRKGVALGPTQHFQNHRDHWIQWYSTWIVDYLLFHPSRKHPLYWIQTSCNAHAQVYPTCMLPRLCHAHFAVKNRKLYIKPLILLDHWNHGYSIVMLNIVAPSISKTSALQIPEKKGNQNRAVWYYYDFQTSSRSFTAKNKYIDSWINTVTVGMNPKLLTTEDFATKIHFRLWNYRQNSGLLWHDSDDTQNSMNVHPKIYETVTPNKYCSREWHSRR